LPVLECLCDHLPTRRSFCRARDYVQERKFSDRVPIASGKISQKLIYRMVNLVWNPPVLVPEPGTPPFDSARAEAVGDDRKFGGGRDFTRCDRRCSGCRDFTPPELSFGAGVCHI
jgi:hypothetical protein